MDAQALIRRFEVACDLKQPVDREGGADALRRWMLGLGHDLPVRWADSCGDLMASANRARSTSDEAMAVVAARAFWDTPDASAAWISVTAVERTRTTRGIGAAEKTMAVMAVREYRSAWDTATASITAIGAAALNNAALFTLLAPILEAFEAGVYYWVVLANEIVAAPTPTVVATDEARRLHCEDGPAFVWMDAAEYYWHGASVPAHVILRPQEITVAEIDEERNGELRRVMIERYGGLGRYLADSDATIIDECGADHVVKSLRGTRLLRREVPGNVPVVAIDLVDSMPMHDGASGRYVLRIDPDFYEGRLGANAWPPSRARSETKTIAGGRFSGDRRITGRRVLTRVDD